MMSGLRNMVPINEASASLLLGGTVALHQGFVVTRLPIRLVSIVTRRFN